MLAIIGPAILTVFLLGMSAVFVTSDRTPIKENPPKFNDPIYSQMRKEGKIFSPKQKPSDWFYIQRVYPGVDIPPDQPKKAMDQARKVFAAAKTLKRNSSSVVWEEAGPTNIPGRITDLAIHPDHPEVIYAASAAGGVFKSANFGLSWIPIFDNVGTPSIGAIAIHPNDPNILYVGTGEANSSGDSYAGTGIYKTTNAGATWEFKGLPNSLHIGRIVIDPLRPDTIYVAVLGSLFQTSAERGLYRSINGGDTWEQKLYISDTTACVDVALHPSTGTVFAAMWHRYRSPQTRIVGGQTSGLWRSQDFGETWENLHLHPVTTLPPQTDTLGRIGVSVDPQSQTVWAIFFDHPGDLMGVFRSNDLGTTWWHTQDAALKNMGGGFGWYFGQIRVAPGNPDLCFALGVYQYRTVDGGYAWVRKDNNIHVDHHAMYILPTNHNRIYNGCDGGVNYTQNKGDSWVTYHAQPSTQFYAIKIDPNHPERLYGGTQDNGTMRTMSANIAGYEEIFGGDGFYVEVDHSNSDIFYVEYQWGNMYKYNPAWGWEDALSGMDYYADRHNWCTPFAMDPHHSNILYYGSNRLWKTENACATWTPISGDMSNGPGGGTSTFGTMTTIGLTPADSQVIYVGYDDGTVAVTQNGGASWTDITDGLPTRWVTRVTPDPYDPAVVYVTLSGYKESDMASHVYRSTNYGQDWVSIGDGLIDAPTNDILVDPTNTNSLFVGTDVGVFITYDLGEHWEVLGDSGPMMVVHDLDFHPGSRTLVAGTHGRSMYKAFIPDMSDPDGDGVIASEDNCPDIYNPLQTDTDNDGIGDVCDNCIDTYNPEQIDTDLDGFGDLCDNCPDVYNPGQEDADLDNIGDACDYICGDANGDKTINLLDILYLIDHIYGNPPGSAPVPFEAGDVNYDSFLNLLDILALIDNIYGSGMQLNCK
mgnify:CR=1 FL=1